MHLSALIEGQPEDGLLRLRRGRAYAEQQRWELARSDFEKAGELGTSDITAQHQRALLQLQCGDTEKYRQACAELLSRHGKSADPDTVRTVIWACTLVPNAVPELTTVHRLAEELLARNPKDPKSLTLLEAILHRMGRFETALQRFSEAEEERRFWSSMLPWWKWSERSFAGFPFHAMAHHRLGQQEKAEFVMGGHRVDVDKAARSGLLDDGELHPPWMESLELQLLDAEAKVLIPASSPGITDPPKEMPNPEKGMPKPKKEI